MELLKIYDEKLLKSLAEKNIPFEKATELLNKHVKEVIPTLDKSQIKTVNLKGHEIDFFIYWNKFIQNKPLLEHELDVIIDTFASNLSTVIINIKYTKGNFLETLITRFKASNDYCRKSGKYITANLDKKLEFTLKQFNRKKVIHEGKEYSSGDFVELSPNPFIHKIYEKIVDFPSGNIMINDYFRCKSNEFNDAIENITEEDDYSEENSINYHRGRVKTISELADLDFISVNVSNTSPKAFKYKDKLIFGEMAMNKDEDWEDRYERTNKDPTFLGRICTDLWNVSIIDETVFVNILISSGIDKTTAKKHLAKVKKEANIKLKVTPGKYRVIFCGYYDDFDTLYRKKNKDKIPKKYKPYFIVEKV